MVTLNYELCEIRLLSDVGQDLGEIFVGSEFYVEWDNLYLLCIQFSNPLFLSQSDRITLYLSNGDRNEDLFLRDAEVQWISHEKKEIHVSLQHYES